MRVQHQETVAYDIDGTSVAGTAFLNGVQHAGYWDAATQAFINLHPFLSGCTASAASGVQIQNGVVRVFGEAMDTELETHKAVVWTQTVPEPASLFAMAGSLLSGAVVRRRRLHK